MIVFTLSCIILAMLPLWLLGALKFYNNLKRIKMTPEIEATGFDPSNRLNRFRLDWHTDTRPWELAKYKEFAYLRMDDWEQAQKIAEDQDDRL